MVSTDLCNGQDYLCMGTVSNSNKTWHVLMCAINKKKHGRKSVLKCLNPRSSELDFARLGLRH